jgi:hypothetical protein
VVPIGDGQSRQLTSEQSLIQFQLDEEEQGGLRGLAEVLLSYGQRHFDGPPNQRGSRKAVWAGVLLMCGQFERVGCISIYIPPRSLIVLIQAVAALWEQPETEIEAVHLAIALAYHGLLRVPSRAETSDMTPCSCILQSLWLCKADFLRQCLSPQTRHLRLVSRLLSGDTFASSSRWTQKKLYNMYTASVSVLIKARAWARSRWKTRGNLSGESSCWPILELHGKNLLVVSDPMALASYVTGLRLIESLTSFTERHHRTRIFPAKAFLYPRIQHRNYYSCCQELGAKRPDSRGNQTVQPCRRLQHCRFLPCSGAWQHNCPTSSR